MFVSLTDAEEHDEVFINLDQIEAFYPGDGYSIVMAKSRTSYSVEETLDEILDKIREVAEMASGVPPRQGTTYSFNSIEDVSKIRDGL